MELRMYAALKHSSSRSVGLWLAMVSPLPVPSTHTYQTGWFLLRKTENEWHTEVTGLWAVLKSSWARVRNSLTRTQSSCQEMTFKWLLTWALGDFSLIWVTFYMKGLRGSHFLSLLPISSIFGVQRPPCIFTSLSFSVQVDQVPADIFLKLWIFFESYSEASFFIFFQILINDLINDSCSAGDLGSIHGYGRSTGEGNGNPFSILAWEITWAEEPCGLQSIGSQGVRHDWATNTFTLLTVTLI